MAVTTAARTRVEVRPITDADRAAVGGFLHEHLNRRIPADAWAHAVDVPWAARQPDHGVMLVEDEQIVGAYLAFYSERVIGGRSERFCNLGAWYVLPGHRLHALKLLRALLARDDMHFTDLSPSGSVVGLNARLGFRFLDTRTALMPNLPWPSRPGRVRISSDPAAIEAALRGRDLAIYRDHARARATRHVLLQSSEACCHVVFRRDRRKGLPLFVSILHVSDAELFREGAPQLARHLLLRHGAAATLVERTVAPPPRRAFAVSSPRRKMFRSATLGPDDIDLLYSELACVSW